MARRRPVFVIQKHAASSLHYDFRLEVDGVLRSWAVPKGPSLDPGVRRLAMQVPDHGVEHAEFEGVHAGSPRGTGAVIIWDEGEFELVREQPDHLVVELHGEKLQGGFAFTRTGERRWILVKTADGAARRGSDVVAERYSPFRTIRGFGSAETVVPPLDTSSPSRLTWPVSRR